MTSQPDLTDEEAALLRDSPILHGHSRQQAVELFYANLFDLRPDLRGLFPEDMVEQSRKFSATLAVSIFSVSDWEIFGPVVEALARRHLRYGVSASDYQDVGKALAKTAAETGCTPDQIAGWNKLYDALAAHMIRTAYPDQARP